MGLPKGPGILKGILNYLDQNPKPSAIPSSIVLEQSLCATGFVSELSVQTGARSHYIIEILGRTIISRTYICPFHKRYLGSFGIQQGAYRSNPNFCFESSYTVDFMFWADKGPTCSKVLCLLMALPDLFLPSAHMVNCLHACRIKKEQSAKESADKKETPAAVKSARDSAASSAKPKQRRQVGIDKTDKDVHHVLYKVIGQVGTPPNIRM